MRQVLDLQPVELLLAELGRVRRTDQEDDRALVEPLGDQRVAVRVRLLVVIAEL